MQKEQVRIFVRDREGDEVEKVFGGRSLLLLSGDSLLARGIISIIKRQLFARIYGWIQKTRFSRRRISKIITQYDIDSSEFLADIEDFKCFNDFFTRELKKERRPIAAGEDVAVTPCDAKYLVFQSFSADKPLIIKNSEYYLDELLGDANLAKRYCDGALVLIRLDPTDYHRFHFPFDCVPGSPRMINGYLYPVNPYTMYENLLRYLEDKRAITTLDSDVFGEVLFIEIGATTVGSINQTFQPHEPYKKGDEKGFFSFGGSSVILLFKKGKIEFDADLTEMSAAGIEVKASYGQSLGRAIG